NSLGGGVALRLAARGDRGLAGVVPVGPAGVGPPPWVPVIGGAPPLRGAVSPPVPPPPGPRARAGGGAGRRPRGRPPARGRRRARGRARWWPRSPATTATAAPSPATSRLAGG